MISLLLAATIGVPSPMPTLPIDYDKFCASQHAGEYEGVIVRPVVIIRCSKADFKFTRGPVPERIPHRGPAW